MGGGEGGGEVGETCAAQSYIRTYVCLHVGGRLMYVRTDGRMINLSVCLTFNNTADNRHVFTRACRMYGGPLSYLCCCISGV